VVILAVVTRAVVSARRCCPAHRGQQNADHQAGQQALAKPEQEIRLNTLPCHTS
jgi:hypothetical protein